MKSKSGSLLLFSRLLFALLYYNHLLPNGFSVACFVITDFPFSIMHCYDAGNGSAIFNRNKERVTQ